MKKKSSFHGFRPFRVKLCTPLKCWGQKVPKKLKTTVLSHFWELCELTAYSMMILSPLFFCAKKKRFMGWSEITRGVPLPRTDRHYLAISPLFYRYLLMSRCPGIYWIFEKIFKKYPNNTSSFQKDFDCFCQNSPHKPRGTDTTLVLM